MCVCSQQLLPDPMARTVDAVVREGAAAAAAAAVAHAYRQVREFTAPHFSATTFEEERGRPLRGTISIHDTRI